ncbi:hypothetical protein GCM10023091_28780 [Ravibacter arvi]|uniref:Uncharacterized protein n=1 Tax=Ravibacter arvi TaxID=2051041 RepID=A0ABP8M300_9BACT
MWGRANSDGSQNKNPASGDTALAGCEPLTEINQNPDDLADERVNPVYVLTSVVTGSATALSDVSFSGNVTQLVLS